jgi:hypothetical protein
VGFLAGEDSSHARGGIKIKIKMKIKNGLKKKNDASHDASSPSFPDRRYAVGGGAFRLVIGEELVSAEFLLGCFLGELAASVFEGDEVDHLGRDEEIG